MAPIPNFSSVLFPLAAAAVLLASPACSTSPRALEHSHSKGFRVELKHVDSGKNLTRFEKIQRGIKRGRNRLQKMNSMFLDEKFKPISISSQISSEDGIGEFEMTFKIGTPWVEITGIADTGSDLVWTQCSEPKPKTTFFDRDKLTKQKSASLYPYYKSSSFSKVPCPSKICELLPQATCGVDCRYMYSYGDGSYTRGSLATEILTFGSVSETSKFGSVSIPNVVIGCGEDTSDDNFNRGAALVGLGRGPLSLVSQIEEPVFSYCVSYEDHADGGTLLMGSLASLNSKPLETQTTPMIKNPSAPSFYYISLEGITVGGTKLSIKKFLQLEGGTGGLIIDSGTTVTIIDKSVFDLVENLLTKQTNLTVDKSGKSDLPLCFKMPEKSGKLKLEVPRITFHFHGADLELPAGNYMIQDHGLLCLAMVPTQGSLSIFGNYQQQNIMVTHDLVKETISFVPTQCATI